MLGLSELEAEALSLSLWVSLWAMLISLPPGLAAAWLLARRRFPGKTLIDGLIHLPLVLPPVVTGYLLLVVLGRRGVVGAWLHEHLGLTLAFNWKGAAVAAAVLSFPLLVRAIRLSIEAVDRGLEQAARTLGAGPWRVFFTVTLPLCLPGVLSGMVLAFARGLGEFGATITFVSNIPNQTRTLPLALYSVLQVPGGEEAAQRLCLISIVLALLALLASEFIARRLAARLEG
ncbi:MAG: molybdate ABC transporter permease subunit [Pseudomonadota bacterium]